MEHREHLTEAWRHVKACGAASSSRQGYDLYDLLANVRREETFQPYFAGVRGLLRCHAACILMLKLVSVMRV